MSSRTSEASLYYPAELRPPFLPEQFQALAGGLHDYEVISSGGPSLSRSSKAILGGREMVLPYR